MQNFAHLNQEKKDILGSVKDACNLYTDAHRVQECKDFLNRYGSYFSQTIFNNMELRKACQSIGICTDNYSLTNPTQVFTSTKHGKCIFGMNYWCTTRANAELCNVKQFNLKYFFFYFFSRLSNYVNVKFGQKIKIQLFKSKTFIFFSS